jgi:hypothetical protein
MMPATLQQCDIILAHLVLLTWMYQKVNKTVCILQVKKDKLVRTDNKKFYI